MRALTWLLSAKRPGLLMLGIGIALAGIGIGLGGHQ